MSVWKYVCAQRLEKQMNVFVPLAAWYRRETNKGEIKKVLRRVQMCIEKDPGNRLLNKSKTILIWILSVTVVFLHFYFGD